MNQEKLSINGHSFLGNKIENGFQSPYQQKGNKYNINKQDAVYLEYVKRKEEAEINKARARGVLFYPAVKLPPKAPQVLHHQVNAPKIDYEEKLKKIRMENFMKKPNVVANNLNLIEQNRLKKIAALRQQSEEQKKKFEAELEKNMKYAEKDKKLVSKIDFLK